MLRYLYIGMRLRRTTTIHSLRRTQQLNDVNEEKDPTKCASAKISTRNASTPRNARENDYSGSDELLNPMVLEKKKRNFKI